MNYNTKAIPLPFLPVKAFIIYVEFSYEIFFSFLLVFLVRFLDFFIMVEIMFARLWPGKLKRVPVGHTCYLVCYVASMIGQAVLDCYLLSPIYHILLNRLHKRSYMKLFYYIPIWVLIYFNLFSLHYEPFGGSGNFDFISIFCVLFCFLNAVRGPGGKFLPDRDLAQS